MLDETGLAGAVEENKPVEQFINFTNNFN